MVCPHCKTSNDPDAQFCIQCGGAVRGTEVKQTTGAGRKQYLYALLLVPVLIIAAGIGYYKFFLPAGIAAVVNGEQIELSELDDAVFRATGSREPADARMRYQLLNGLITERLILQEARNEGMTVSREEMAAVSAQSQAASGLDQKAFNGLIAEQYGSMQLYEKMVMRGLLVSKFISEKIVPANADPRTATAALDRWLQNRSASASVRVTLAEQWSGAGCGCCSNKAAGSSDRPGCAKNRTLTGKEAGALSGGDTDKAAQAGLQYWKEKHGAESVKAKVADFGCHMQVDIIKDDKVIGSLRYQGGAISEQ